MLFVHVKNRQNRRKKSLKIWEHFNILPYNDAYAAKQKDMNNFGSEPPKDHSCQRRSQAKLPCQ